MDNGWLSEAGENYDGHWAEILTYIDSNINYNPIEVGYRSFSIVFFL